MCASPKCGSVDHHLSVHTLRWLEDWESQGRQKRSRAARQTYVHKYSMVSLNCSVHIGDVQLIQSYIIKRKLGVSEPLWILKFIIGLFYSGLRSKSLQSLGSFAIFLI